MIFAGLMVIGTFTPPTSVIAGDEVSQSDVDILRAEGIIAGDEKLILFYSAGMISVREDGNIITDKRVISYEEVDDELWIGSARFDQIQDLSIIEEGDLIPMRSSSSRSTTAVSSICSYPSRSMG